MYLNCKSKQDIYILNYLCFLVYVGKPINAYRDTKATTKKEINNFHMGEEMNLKKPVAIHFARERHQVDELRAMVIDNSD